MRFPTKGGISSPEVAGDGRAVASRTAGSKKWLNEPPAWRVDGDQLTVTSTPTADFYRMSGWGRAAGSARWARRRSVGANHHPMTAKAFKKKSSVPKLRLAVPTGSADGNARPASRPYG